MARSRRKNGGPTSGRFKKKRLGKGWLANRRQRSDSRPVLRITEAETPAEGKASKTAKG